MGDVLPINGCVRAKLIACYLQAKGFWRAGHRGELAWTGLYPHSYMLRGSVWYEPYQATARDMIVTDVRNMRERERSKRVPPLTSADWKLP